MLELEENQKKDPKIIRSSRTVQQSPSPPFIKLM
jgi:hypothetical protein